MRVEVLYFDGCPHHEPLIARVRELLTAAGRSDEVVLVNVGSEAEAVARRFLGSPTLRVDGVDADPAARGRDDFGLTCRLYATAAGLEARIPDEIVARALGTRAASCPAG